MTPKRTRLAWLLFIIGSAGMVGTSLLPWFGPDLVLVAGMLLVLFIGCFVAAAFMVRPALAASCLIALGGPLLTFLLIPAGIGRVIGMAATLVIGLAGVVVVVVHMRKDGSG